MTGDIEQGLKLDLEEITRFVEAATRPHIKQQLASIQSGVQLRLKEAEKLRSQQTETATASAASTTTREQFEPISTYGWDQEGKDISIYISGLAGVGNLPKEQVQTSFTSTSLDVRIYGLEGKNKRLRVPALHEKVDTDKCRAIVKADRMVIKLKKAEAGHWSRLDLDPKKPKFNAKSDDPTAGIMDVMKNLYEEGDDEMKRTIGKAWLFCSDANFAFSQSEQQQKRPF